MEENTTSTGTGTQGAAAHVHGPGCFICNVARPLFERYWSEATRDHFRNSRIEFLKGIRSLIDHRIEHLSRHEQHHGTRLTVE